MSEAPLDGERARLRKVVVWDLDRTLWDGVLLEGEGRALRPGALEVLRALDQRGVLLSIASRNERADALARLRELGVDELFLCPQIHWGDKAGSLRAIASTLDVATDSLVFVDDEPFERDAVSASLPDVLCLDAADLPALLTLPELTPRVITDEARQRRALYRAELARREAERAHQDAEPDATPDSFLLTLGLELDLARASEEDLARAEELTLRTHQMNTTGIAYSRDDLRSRLADPDHAVWVARLRDRYGSYGTVGLALLARDADGWIIELFLTSCRVVPRGVGSLFLGHLLREAQRSGAALRARFRPTDRNRMMLITYRFAGFREVGRDGESLVLAHDLRDVPAVPSHVTLTVQERGA